MMKRPQCTMEILHLSFTQRRDVESINQQRSGLFIYLRNVASHKPQYTLWSQRGRYHIVVRLVSVFASSALGRIVGLSAGWVKPKTIKLVFVETCKAKSKDWLDRNQDNVFKWSDMYTLQLLCKWVSTVKFQLSVLV